ncbi:MAG TPA: DsbC family protein [Usitatibacter sp.]|nr:DsbC family protein [Usitatibacter sp.]
MKLSTLVAAAGVSILVAFSAGAQDTDKMKVELQHKVPEAVVESVRKIPYGGLYEAVISGDIYYTNATMDFIITGAIIDLKTSENITDKRMQQLTAIKWDTLPLDQAIKITRGNGSRKIAIFEDPNCGYCKRFERDLQGFTDITIYVMLYPILSPDSMEKSKAIWCSADPGKVWLDHMVRDAAINGDTKCATPIDKNLALGQSKRVRGTPTLIFENGDRIPGAIPAADLEKKFAQVKVALSGGATAPVQISAPQANAPK